MLWYGPDVFPDSRAGDDAVMYGIFWGMESKVYCCLSVALTVHYRDIALHQTACLRSPSRCLRLPASSLDKDCEVQVHLV